VSHLIRRSSFYHQDQHLGCHSELLNKVWGLEGCPFKGQTIRTNRSVRFGFGGSTVLVASREDQVSCYTTEGDSDVLKVQASSHLIFLHETLQDHHFLFDLG
jgi:hypothetical protein